MNIICLDAEMADGINHELLELSVLDGSMNEVYHHYFKPRITKEWKGSERVHHITPEMVRDEPHFDECLSEIQAVVDKAECVVGFAVENDIFALEYSGVTGLRDKLKVDVRELFWAYCGNPCGMSLDSIPGLVACAEVLGVEFSQHEAHSASADTLATFRCLEALRAKAADTAGGEMPQLNDMVEFCERSKFDYRRRHAQGWAYIMRSSTGGYKLRFKTHDEVDPEKVVMKKKVNDRHVACYDLHNMFDKKASGRLGGALNLSAADMRKFESYSNEYDEEKSAYCKSALRLRRLTLS